MKSAITKAPSRTHCSVSVGYEPLKASHGQYWQLLTDWVDSEVLHSDCSAQCYLIVCVSILQDVLNGL